MTSVLSESETTWAATVTRVHKYLFVTHTGQYEAKQYKTKTDCQFLHQSNS